ncbi:MAG: putative ABC transport system permease protein, partial [Woeseiaceae bacterium]
MKLLVFALRAFYRQIRSGEVVVLIVAISLAVASLTAVGFLTDRISTSIERQANELLAADLRIRSPEEIPATWIEIASEQGLDVALSQSFPTVVYAGSKSALATIKAVSNNYPLRGKVRISKTQYGDEYVAHSIPNENSVWVDSALLSRLKAKIGDFISIGNNDFKIDAVLRYRPDQSIGFASLAPSILVNLAAIPSTNLITEGSRVNYSLLLAGEEQQLEDYTNDIAGLMSESARISDRSDSNERTNQAINRSQQFLSMT